MAQHKPLPMVPALLTDSLNRKQLDDHKAKLNVLQEMMYAEHDKFGWERMDAQMQVLLHEKWAETLAPFSFDEVKAACFQHTIEQPNKVPNAGHIHAIILNGRRKLVARQQKVISQKSTRESPSPEFAKQMREQIAREFPQVKRFGGKRSEHV